MNFENRKINLLDNNQGFIRLLDYMGDELDIINAARVSYGKQIKKMGDKDFKLLRYLIEHKHTSPFEMVEFKFEVYCPMFVRNQWMRHRTWNYNEISRRYTSKNIHIYMPDKLRKQDKNNKQKGSKPFYSGSKDLTEDQLIGSMLDFSQESLNVYEKLIANGVCREQARMVLPQSLMTNFIGKVDLKNLIHFLKLRMGEDSQLEIQVYANAIIELIEPIVPTVIDELFPNRQ